MNIYKTTFVAGCPANGHKVSYFVRIASSEMIRVESIAEFFQSMSEGFHEDIADKAFALFGGFQTIKAIHHGVEIKTVRGGSL